jgi:hypothetical protein
MSGRLSTAISYIPTQVKLGAVSEGVKAIHGGTGNFLSGLFELITAEERDTTLDNPFFTQNGHDGPSPATVEYFEVRKGLKILATMGTAIGDIGGIVSVGQAGSYGLTWYKLNALFEKLVPPSRRAKPVVYAHWYSYEVAKKAVPAGSLETRLRAIIRQKMYGTASGTTKALITFGTGGWTGFFVNSAATWIAPTLDSWFGQDIIHLAQGLHWFAFLETVVGRGRGKGPALRILEVIWEELGLGKVSLPSIAKIVREPRGWLVIADVLA